ncbi:MAG: CBS domain-containing protein, partial [Nitrospinae bacterium]|nr:CBS domain-containing protein [Nitrospinota bacterium]
MNISEILQPNVLTIKVETDFVEAISLMSNNHISCLVITKNKKAAGIITERDIVRITANTKDLHGLTVEGVMSKPVITLKGSIDILQAYHLLKENKVRHLVVIDEKGEVIGIVTPSNIISKLGIEYFVELKAVSQVMTSMVETTQKEAPLMDAIKKMAKHLISCVIVEEENKPVGIITERDISILIKKNQDINSLKVKDIMSSPVLTINAETHIHNAVQQMKEKSIRRLIVVDEQGFISGVITQSNLISGLEGEYIKSLKECLNKTTDELKNNEKKFSNMFYSHSAVMLLIDPENDGQIVDANVAATKFYGYPLEELKKLQINKLNMLPDAWLKRDMKKVTDGARNYFVFKHRLADGSIKDVEVHSSEIITSGKRLLFSIIHDITERKSFENELRLKREELQSLNRKLEERVHLEKENAEAKEQMLIQQSKLASMGEMIGSIAHQWKQPLNTLGLIIQDIEEAYEFEDMTKEYITETVEKSMEQIEYMSQTIDDFRNFFKPPKGNEDFIIHEAVLDVISLVAIELKNNFIKLSIECKLEECGKQDIMKECITNCTHRELMRTRGIPNEFKQVILNLIKNAKEAILDNRQTKGNEEEEGTIDIHLDINNNKNIIEIIDNGGGIPNKTLQKIFDPYFTTKDEKTGTGIGLYISKKIIEEKMGGSLTVKNSEKGAS